MAQKRKEDIQIAAASKGLKAKTKADKVSRKVKEKTTRLKNDLEVTAAEAEVKVEKPIRKARAAKIDMIFETNGGMQIRPEEIAQKIPKGADAAYIKLEENKIYWVKGEETGSVDIW